MGGWGGGGKASGCVDGLRPMVATRRSAQQGPTSLGCSHSPDAVSGGGGLGPSGGVLRRPAPFDPALTAAPTPRGQDPARWPAQRGQVRVGGAAAAAKPGGRLHAGWRISRRSVSRLLPSPPSMKWASRGAAAASPARPHGPAHREQPRLLQREQGLWEAKGGVARRGAPTRPPTYRPQPWQKGHRGPSLSPTPPPPRPPPMPPSPHLSPRGVPEGHWHAHTGSGGSHSRNTAAGAGSPPSTPRTP